MSDEPKDDVAPDSLERVAKRISRAGVASRREAERLIDAGRVTVDGETIRSPALDVGPDAVIAIDSVPIPKPARTRVWCYHKPAGLLVTRTDPQGRRTIYMDLPAEMSRAISIGRLDYTSEGLLLLTNDGELARKLELPSEGLVRHYRARAYGYVDQKALDRLARGITVDGVRYGPIQATLEEARGANAWIALTLTEGKNREVRNVLRAVGLHVNRLIRTAYGPFKLGDMPPGAFAEVPVVSLMRDLGVATERPKGWAKATPKAKQRPGKNARLAARKPGDKRPEPRPAEHRPGDRRPSGKAHDAPGRDKPAATVNRSAPVRADTRRPDARAPSAARGDGDRVIQRRDPAHVRTPRAEHGPRRDERPVPAARNERPNAERKYSERPREPRRDERRDDRRDDPRDDKRPAASRPYGDRSNADRPRAETPREHGPRRDGHPVPAARNERPNADRKYSDRPRAPHRDEGRDDKRPSAPPRPYGERSNTDRPRAPRAETPREHGPRRDGHPVPATRNERPNAERKYSDRPREPRRDVPRDDKRPGAARPYGERSNADRPRAPRRDDARPAAPRPNAERKGPERKGDERSREPRRDDKRDNRSAPNRSGPGRPGPRGPNRGPNAGRPGPRGPNADRRR